MSQTAEAVDISARPRAASARPKAVAVGPEQSTATLDILPLPVTRSSDFTEWTRVRQRLGQIANLQLGWNGTKGIAPDLQTVIFAGTELIGLQRLGVPAPSIHPSADGAVYAEWHAMGLDIELIFEAPYQLVVLIEDARNEVQAFEGESPDSCVALDALKALASR